MGRETGGAEEETDDEVRAHRGVRREADAPEQRRHAEGSEDQADGAAQEADEPAGDRFHLLVRFFVIQNDFRTETVKPCRVSVTSAS